MSWSGWIRIIYLAFLIVLPIFTNASERKPKASDIIGRFGSKLDELRRDCLGVNHIQNEVDGKVKVKEPLDGEKLIKELSNVIRKRFAYKIAALQELKRGVEEDYSRNYVAQHDCCNLPITTLKYDPRFKAKVDPGHFCEMRSEKSKKSARGLGDSFMEAMYKNVKKNPRLKWQYFGSTEGVTSRFPSRSVKDCEKYENRVKRWYVTTASPTTKNIVIVLDTSTSMAAPITIGKHKTNRLAVAKEAVHSLLNTLLPEDKVGVVLFSTKVHLPKNDVDGCFSSGLASASSFNVKNLKSFISKASPGGGTNYKKSFDAAFTLLKNSSDVEKGSKRPQAVMLFITDGAPVDRKDAIFNAIRTHQDKMYDDNRRVPIVAYGIGTDNKMISFLKRLSVETIAKFKPVENVANLNVKLTTYYEYLQGAEDTKIQAYTLSPPYLDAWGLGVLITASIPCFRYGVLKGVAAIDIAIPDLFSEVQYFNQAGPDSYAFIAHQQNGIVLSHPFMSPQENVTKDPTLLNIFHLERGEAFKKFFRQLNGGNGVQSMVVRGRRRSLSRGGTNEGVREVTMDYHYHCRLLMEYTACVVLAASDNQMSIKDTKDKPVVKFTAKAFNVPSDYLNVDETPSNITKYMNYLNHKTGHTMFINGIAETARIGLSLDKFWTHSKYPTQIPRRFFGTFNGVLRFFPGEPLPRNYDHSNRHWYLKAKAYPNQLMITTPYRDPLGAGIIVSISQSISMATQSPKQKSLFGVVAADLSMSYFETLIRNDLGFRCKDTRTTTCFLVNTSGYVVFHPRFSQRKLYDDVKNKHITKIHGDIASYLIKAGVMRQKTCQDLSEKKLQKFYELDLGNDDIIQNIKETAGRCDTFVMTRIPQTNIFVVASIANTVSKCYDSASCHCDLTCSSVANTTCECPCTKRLDYNYCNDTIKDKSIPSCTSPSAEISSRPPLPPNTADLPKCFDPRCEEIESEGSCRKTFGCSWCRWEEAKELEVPFCSYDNGCYGGVLDRKNPFIRKLGPKTIKVNPTDQDTGLLSIKNLPFIGAAIGAFLLLITIISISFYCCCCRKKKTEEPSEMDGYYDENKMQDDGMYPQGYDNGYVYGQEYYDQDGGYVQEEYQQQYYTEEHLDF